MILPSGRICAFAGMEFNSMLMIQLLSSQAGEPLDFPGR